MAIPKITFQDPAFEKTCPSLCPSGYGGHAPVLPFLSRF